MSLLLSACGGDDPPAECEAATCGSLDYECGTHSDNCGDTITCGTCQAGFDCVTGVCQACQPETCTTLDAECGTQADGCGGTIECGSCTDGTCQAGTCVPDQCTPATCASLDYECGAHSDTCGGTLSCGNCDAGFSCQAGSCVADQCVPDTCQDLGVQCGTHDNGCEGTVYCGGCAGQYHECQDGTCVCIARTCADLGRECGEWNDGCGGTVTCGPCAEGDICRFDGRCIGACVPLTCEGVGADCGTINDGCGGTASCGGCSGGLVCGAQAPNQCGEGECTPTTCQSLNFECGSHTDGCGEFIACGPCGANEYCNSQYQCVESAASCDLNSFSSVDEVAIYFAETDDGPVLHYAADSAASFPLDRLTIQWWFDYGAPFTGVGTYTLDPNTNLADCGLCLYVQKADVDGNVTKFFFATEGEIEVTEVGADGEPFAAVLHDVVLAEWGETDEAVVGGQTWCIDGYSWSVLLDGELNPVVDTCDHSGFTAVEEAGVYGVTADGPVLAYVADSGAALPFDRLTVEWWFDFGANYNGPGLYPIPANSNLADCGLCVYLQKADVDGNVTHLFFATEGEVEITEIGDDGEPFSGILHDVVLVEWGATDEAVVGGQTWCLDGYSWTTPLDGSMSTDPGTCDYEGFTSVDDFGAFADTDYGPVLAFVGDSAAAVPLDRLSVEWWLDYGADFHGPGIYPVETNSNLATCGLCVYIQRGDASGTLVQEFFATEGTVEITEIGGDGQPFAAVLHDVVLREWNANDEAVADGETWCVDGFSWSTPLDGTPPAPNSIVDETLRLGSLPAGWTDSSITWATTTGGYAHFTGLTSTLRTPVLNLSGYDAVALKFDVAKHGTGVDGPITVEVSNDGGATWTAQTFDSPVPSNADYLTSGPTLISATSNQVAIRFSRANSPSAKRLRDVTLVGYIY